MARTRDTSEPVELVVGERTVRITHPERVYFPATGATKLDLAQYYLSVGDGIVRALRERPCMMHRFPEGLSGDKVHQKRLPRGAPPWVETVQLFFPRFKRTADELCVTELGSVIWAVQMSTVEFHPWNSRRADTEKPDEWRIDLDPMPDCDFQTVRRVAHVAHEVLDEIGAVGWPKTSGGKGMHIYVRMRAAVRFRPADRPDLVEHLVSDMGNPADGLEVAVRHRVQIDPPFVRLLGVGPPRVPRMELDRGHLHCPDHAAQFGDAELVGRPLEPREEQLNRLDPRRSAAGKSFLVDLVAAEPLREPVHHAGPLAKRPDDPVPDAQVVLGQIQLGRAGCREVDPLGMGDPHRALTDDEFHRFAGIAGAGHDDNLPIRRPERPGTTRKPTGRPGTDRYEPTNAATAWSIGVEPPTTSSESPRSGARRAGRAARPQRPPGESGRARCVRPG